MEEQVITVSTIAFQGYELPTVLREIAASGVQYVEFAFIMGYSEDLSEETFSPRNARTLKGLLENYGLKTVALAAHMDLGLENAVSAFKCRMDFAKQLGARMVLTNSSVEKNRDIFLHNMEKLAEYAESLDVTIAFENPGDGQNNLIPCGRDGAEIVNKINSPFVRLNYDFCNTFSYSKGKLRPEQDFQHAFPYASHVHLKDMRADDRGWYFSEIGSQLIDYDQILSFLFRQPERIPIGLELPSRVRRDKSFNPHKKTVTPSLEDIRSIVKTSVEYVQGVLEKSK
ncbi:MAG: sugar phosphate isomerase/epimerase family protein [Planctomycetota bacterium]|jgi:sugar phosphate isomerase/epimerase